MFCGLFVFQSSSVFLGGTWVSLTTSHCHSVSFCIALSVVSALNSRAIQSEACISAAKYKRSSFFSESRVEITFRLISLWTKSNRNNENPLTFLKILQFPLKLKCTLICPHWLTGHKTPTYLHLFVFECKQVWIIITVLCLFFWGRGRLQWLLLAWQVDSRPRVVDEPEGRLWADSHGFHYFETSAQTGEGIGDMFQVGVTCGLFIIHESVWKLFICCWHTRFASVPQAFKGVTTSNSGECCRCCFGSCS